jgi:predicted O-linked N-acetylglucosamine transferase (SPINDLY family)
MTANISSMISQGVDQFQKGNLDNAERLISTALKIQPKNPDALQILGVIKNLKGEHEEGIRLLKKAISLDPSNGFIHLNLAKALSDTNKDFYALPHHQQAIRTMPENPNAWLNYGVSLVKLHRQEEALVIYEGGLKLHSNTANLWINMSGVLNELLRHEEAIAAAQQALSIDSDQAQAWCNLGSALNSINEFKAALKAFDNATDAAPGLIDAWINKSKAQISLNEIDLAIKSCQEALAIDPRSSAAWFYIGNCLQTTQRIDESLDAYSKALVIDPTSTETMANLGLSLRLNKEYEKSRKAYEDAIALKKPIDYLLGNYFNSLMNLCSWEKYDSLLETISNGIINSQNEIIPFQLLSTPSDLEAQKLCAQLFVKNRIPSFQKSQVPVMTKNKRTKIRIGYFSYDFKEHPVGISIEDIIAMHDRSQFEVFGFFLNKKTGDAIEQRLLKTFDEVFDLFNLSDEAAHSLALSKQLNIALDLNVHTSGSRMALFAKRLAPLQINYLGYAGTSGAEFYDYIIADKIAIDPSQEKFFTEKIAYLPNSFFPINSASMIDESTPIPSRLSQGIPEDVFVFGCFNNAYKITPLAFKVWMGILKEIPNSVLWLSQLPEKAIENLQLEANNCEIAPNRLIFAKRVQDRVEHLSRLRHINLFLDTPYYNAHATSADALSSGVPVLTILGNTFASRVAASQITAAGIPELITNSIDSYKNKAVELANNPQKLAELRNRLKRNKRSSPLFDTKKYVVEFDKLLAGLI